MKRVARHPVTPPSFKLGHIVMLREGTYGPAHDPYSYTERGVHTADGLAVILHSGIGDHISVGSIDEPRVKAETIHLEHKSAQVMFRKLTGMTVEQFDKWYWRVHANECEDPMGPLSRYI